MDAQNLARWTRFALKGGIGRCVAVQDCVAESAEDLMFLKNDEIVVLVQLSDEGRFLGYCEGVVGQFSASDVQFTTKLKKAVFAKRPTSASSTTANNPSGLLTPTPASGGVSATSSPTAVSFRGSILAEPASRPGSVGVGTTVNSNRPTSRASSAVGTELMPPASSVVRPPASMFSPPSRNAELPSSGRNSPVAGRASPAAGRASPASRRGAGSRVISPPPNSTSNRVLSPPPSSSAGGTPNQTSRILSPPPSSTPSSPSTGTRIINPPPGTGRNSSSAASRAQNRIASQSDRESPTPYDHRPHGRERTDESTSTTDSMMSDLASSDPFAAAVPLEPTRSRQPHSSRQQTSSTASSRQGSSSATLDAPVSASTDGEDDGNSTSDMLRRMQAFPAPPTTIPHARTFSTTSSAGRGASPQTSPRGNGSFAMQQQAQAHGASAYPLGRAGTGGGSAGPSPSASPRAATFAAGPGMGESPRMQSFSASGYGLGASTEKSPSPSPNPSPRKPTFGRSTSATSPGNDSSSGASVSNISGRLLTSESTASLGRLPASSSTASLGATSPPRSGSSGQIAQLQQRERPDSGAGFATHDQRGGPAPPRPPKNHSRASSRASVASSVGASGVRPSSTSGTRDRERADAAHSRNHSRASSFSLSLHSRTPSTTNVNESSTKSRGRSSTAHSRSASMRSGESGSAPDSRSSTPARGADRDLERDIQSALFNLGGAGSSNANGSSSNINGLTLAPLGLASRFNRRSASGLGGDIDSPPDTARLTVDHQPLGQDRDDLENESPPMTARPGGEGLGPPAGFTLPSVRGLSPSPNPSSARERSPFGTASPVPPPGPVPRIRGHQESSSTASSASMPGSRLPHGHSMSGSTSNAFSSRAHSRSGSASRNHSQSASRTHSRNPSGVTGPGGLLDIAALERELDLDAFNRENRVSVMHPAHHRLDSTATSTSAFDSSYDSPGSGSDDYDDDEEEDVSGTDSERENGRGPFALDPLHRPTTRKASVRRAPSKRHKEKHSPLPSPALPPPFVAPSVPVSPKPPTTAEADRPLGSGTTFGSAGGSARTGAGSDDDATVDGHGVVPAASLGPLEKMQRRSLAKMERDHGRAGSGIGAGVGGAFDYEARVQAQRYQSDTVRSERSVRSVATEADAPSTARPVELQHPVEEEEQQQSSLKRSDTMMSVQSSRSADGRWDIGVSLMQGGMDSSDEDDEDVGAWSSRAVPPAQPASRPIPVPQPRTFLHPADATVIPASSVPGRFSPLVSAAGRYSPSGSSVGAASGGYSPSAASSNFHGESFVPATTQAPSTPPIARDAPRAAATPESPRPAPPVPATSQPSPPADVPVSSLDNTTGRQTDDQMGEEDEEDDDGEEWDGDSIYEGYRYSRISMVSKRASRFTVSDKDRAAFGGAGGFGFGSPELPTRARGATLTSDRSASPRSIGMGKRSGANSPVSPPFAGRRAGTPNSPSSPLGPGPVVQAGAASIRSVPSRDGTPTFSGPTGAGGARGLLHSTATGKWSPSPVLPLTPTRRADFSSQQQTSPPQQQQQPASVPAPVKSHDEGTLKRPRIPSHIAVTPRPHPALQPIDDIHTRDTMHSSELSTDVGSIMSVAREGMDLPAVQTNGGLDMIAEVHISPDRDDDNPQFASVLSPNEGLLAKGTFAGSPPTSATSSGYDHATPSPRAAFVFPPRKDPPPPPLPRGGRNVFTGMVHEPAPLSASPEPLGESTSTAPPDVRQNLRVDVPPAGAAQSTNPASPGFPLMSASALRARFQEERGGPGSQSGSLTGHSGPKVLEDEYVETLDDSDESVYSSAPHSRPQSTRHSRSNTQDDSIRPGGMRIVTEDGPVPMPIPPAAIFSPADPILPLSARPGGEPEIVPSELQHRFGAQPGTRRTSDDVGSVASQGADRVPRVPDLATFAAPGTPQRPPPPSIASPDTPSPTSMLPRPVGAAMLNNSGRNSPAPANFLPHPNAPIPRTARLLPGTGVGSGVFNPYANAPVPMSTDVARRPPHLVETMAAAAGRQNVTIKARMQFDLSTATSPVPVVWSMLTAAEAHEEDQQDAARPNGPPSGQPGSPVRASPSRAGPKGPHPLSNSVSVGPKGPIPAGLFGPGPAAWRGPDSQSQMDRPRVSSGILPGPSNIAGGLAQPSSLNVPLARHQFNPHVGGQRPRSRSFSGFPAAAADHPILPMSKDDLRSPPGAFNTAESIKSPLPSRSTDTGSDNSRPVDGVQGSPSRVPHRMPSMPTLTPSPLSIPNGLPTPNVPAGPTSPPSRSGPSPLAISPTGPRRFNDDAPSSPLSASPRRGTGLRHASSAMNMSSTARSQSPSLAGQSSLRPGRTSGSVPQPDDEAVSNDGHSGELGPRPTRSLSLRSKISLSAMRAKNSAPDSQRGDAEETVNVQDMEFELVRPVVPAMRGDEARPSIDSRDHDSVRSGHDSMRSGSPIGSSHAHEPLAPAAPQRGLISPVGMPPSQASLDAYRAREQKWMTLISTTPRKNKKVRKLVLEGVPASVRSRVWAYLTDSKSRQTPGVFEQLSGKANSQLAERIEMDLGRLFINEIHLAEPKGKGPVVKILQAYFVMVPDVPYQPDLAVVAGNLALQCPEEEAFWTLVQLMESHLRGYFSAMPVQLDVDAALFAKAVDYADSALSIRLFAEMHVSPVDLCQSWFLSLFARTLPPEIQQRVWDIFLYEGPTFLFRVGLAFLQVVRRQIFSMQGMSVQQVIAFLTRPPPQAFHPDPEAFIELCFTQRIKEDDIRKARIKNAEQQLKERQQGRFAARPTRR